MSGTITLRRKAIKRALPWNLVARELNLVSPPQDEDIPITKKPRLDPIIKSTAAVTNDFNYLCSDSDDEKPIPKPMEDSSSIGAIVDTCTISTLLGKKPSPIATAIVEAADSVTPTASLPSAAASCHRWKPEEDAKLTEAVKKHGKYCWVAVAAQVPGRTRNQCRQRWVKKVDPANVKNPGQPRMIWKPEEDAKLTEAVKKHGKDCWVTVAAMVPGRTNGQCRRRWLDKLDPANEKDPGKPRMRWKQEEVAKLTEAVKNHGKDWVTIAAMVPNRTNEQCRLQVRWVNKVYPTKWQKGKWTPEEDSKLIEAMKKHGNHWVAVAGLVSSRTDKQCRDRWVVTLGPANVKNSGKPRMSWKPEEDAKLTEAVKKHGKDC
jgi:hypothetical protein